MNTLLNLFVSLIYASPFSTPLDHEATEFLAVKQVSIGMYGGCAILENGALKCWGNNDYGQLGLGNTAIMGNTANTIGDKLPLIELNSPTIPVQVVSNSYSTCVLFESGKVKCWGRNSSGQLGYEDVTTRGSIASSVPSKLPFLDLDAKLKVKKITGKGSNSFCALFENGQVKCWGANGSGQLGLGSTKFYGNEKKTMGSKLPFLNFGKEKTVVDIAAANHVCAILNTDEVKCWGVSTAGKTGSGTEQPIGDFPEETPDKLSPINLGVSDARPVQISTSLTHTCVLFDNGRAKCFGENDYGQLGLGHTQSVGLGDTMGEKLPYLELGDLPVSYIYAQNYTTCAQFINYSVKCFGYNGVGALGYGDTLHRGISPETMGDKLPYLSMGTGEAVSEITGYYGTTCFLTKKGLMKCVGENSYGQLAYGDTAPRGHSPGTTPDLLMGVNLGTKATQD